MEKEDAVYKLSEKELSELIDKRIAKVFSGGIEGPKLEDLGEFGPDSVVMATPSVLSIVRATAYAHC